MISAVSFERLRYLVPFLSHWVVSLRECIVSTGAIDFFFNAEMPDCASTKAGGAHDRRGDQRRQPWREADLDQQQRQRRRPVSITAASANTTPAPIIIAWRPTSAAFSLELGLRQPHLLPDQLRGLLGQIGEQLSERSIHAWNVHFEFLRVVQ